jgi:hypothetical protein
MHIHWNLNLEPHETLVIHITLNAGFCEPRPSQLNISILEHPPRLRWSHVLTIPLDLSKALIR